MCFCLRKRYGEEKEIVRFVLFFKLKMMYFVHRYYEMYYILLNIYFLNRNGF